MRIWHMNQSSGWGGPHNWEEIIPIQQGEGGPPGSVSAPNITVRVAKSSQETPKLVAALQRTSGSPDTWLGTGGPQQLRVFSTDPVVLGVSKANIPEAHTGTICFPF